MKRLGSLPLVHQPGERWLYHTGSDVLGVLIARASGQSLGAFLHEHLFEPLGMRDTGFQVPADKLDRLASAYMTDPQNEGAHLLRRRPQQPLEQAAGLRSGRRRAWSRRSTTILAFYRMLLNKGRARRRAHPVAAGRRADDDRPAHAGAEGRARSCSSATARAGAWAALWSRGAPISAPRRAAYGWDGGYGTSAHLDPAEDMVGILMTQRMMESPRPPRVFTDFWTSAYQAIDD